MTDTYTRRNRGTLGEERTIPLEIRLEPRRAVSAVVNVCEEDTLSAIWRCFDSDRKLVYKRSLGDSVRLLRMEPFGREMFKADPESLAEEMHFLGLGRQVID